MWCRRSGPFSQLSVLYFIPSFLTHARPHNPQAVTGIMGTTGGLDLRSARALADEVCSGADVLDGGGLLSFAKSR